MTSLPVRRPSRSQEPSAVNAKAVSPLVLPLAAIAKAARRGANSPLALPVIAAIHAHRAGSSLRVEIVHPIVHALIALPLATASHLSVAPVPRVNLVRMNPPLRATANSTLRAATARHVRSIPSAQRVLDLAATPANRAATKASPPVSATRSPAANPAAVTQGSPAAATRERPLAQPARSPSASRGALAPNPENLPAPSTSSRTMPSPSANVLRPANGNPNNLLRARKA